METVLPLPFFILKPSFSIHFNRQKTISIGMCNLHTEKCVIISEDTLVHSSSSIK
jgi:hypothetical protein